MAWLQTKTTIAAVAVALLGVGATTTVADASPGPDIQGTWEATLVVPGSGVHRWESSKSPIIVRIVETNGDYQVSCDVIAVGLQDLRFETFIYKYPDVHGQISSTIDDFSFFSGKVSSSGEKITLKVWQNNQAFPPMVFRRTTHPTPFPEPLTETEFAPRAGSSLQGFWAGTIGRGKGALHIQFKIAEASDGTFRADMYDPDQDGTNRYPTTVSYDGTAVKLMPVLGDGMFEGWLRNGGKDIVGNWIQNDARTTMTLTLTDFSDFEAHAAK